MSEPVLVVDDDRAALDLITTRLDLASKPDF
jgi:hypothetical protein